MTQLTADQQLTLQAFQAAVDTYTQRQMALPEAIAAILPHLDQHLDQLDQLSETDPTFEMVYQAVRTALQDGSDRAKFLDPSAIPPDRLSSNGKSQNGTSKSHSSQLLQDSTASPSPPSIKRFVLSINPTCQEQQDFATHIAQLKQLNPQWIISPDLPQPDEAEAYVMIFNDENYQINHAAYIASQMLQRFFAHT
jgi:hypothetical protein